VTTTRRQWGNLPLSALALSLLWFCPAHAQNDRLIDTPIMLAPAKQSDVQVSDKLSMSFMLRPDQQQNSIGATSTRWQVIDSLSVNAGVEFTPLTAVQIGCKQHFRSDCIAQPTDSRLIGRDKIESYSVGASWQATSRLSLDVNLYSRPLASAIGQDLWRGEFVELDLAHSEGVDVGLICGFDAGRLGEIELGLQLSHIDQQNQLIPEDPYAAASLGVGWRKGALSGDLTSRFLGSINDNNDVRDGWTTFDLSFGWRTPWNASLSIGAKNILDTPAPEGQILNNRNIDDLFGRVPYVRYQQDL